MFFVGRFAQDLPVALGHGIATKHQSAGDFQRHVGGLLPRQAGDELFGRLPAANAALGRLVGQDDLEIVARLGQQFSPPRRTAGEDQFGLFLAVHGVLSAVRA